RYHRRRERLRGAAGRSRGAARSHAEAPGRCHGRAYGRGGLPALLGRTAHRGQLRRAADRNLSCGAVAAEGCCMMRWVVGLVVAVALGMGGAGDAGAQVGQGTLGNIFVRSERIVLPLRGVAPGTPWAVRDFFGTAVASGQVGGATIE